MSTSRTIHLFESIYDNGKIKDNQWQWQIAKAVSNGSAPAVSNLIWQSLALAPTMSVKWDVIYGLNWTASPPAAGVTVDIGGNWQECAKGQVYDIDDSGYWTGSQEAPQEGWMKVGKVNYSYPGAPGIHILVGVKNAKTSLFDLIYVDSVSLPIGGRGIYQPQEHVIWWYEGGNMTGQVYSSTGGDYGEVDMTNPAPITKKFEWWTTYTFDDGNWSNSQYPPPLKLLGPPKSVYVPKRSTDEINLFPILRDVIFTIAVAGVSAQAAVCNYLTTFLSSLFTEVEVTFTTASGTQLTVSYGSPHSASEGTRESIGLLLGGGEDSTAVINEGLLNEVKIGLLPPDEIWQFALGSKVNGD
jgi:hypothetical protein